MTMDDILFWIIGENDINNEEIYLSSGTPLNNINPKRLYESLKKRHARQRQRLLKNQISELHAYHKEFIQKNKNDLFITPSTAVCQEIQGLDFLSEHNNIISELFSSTHSDISIADERDKLDDLQMEERSKLYIEIIRKKYIQGFNDLNNFHMAQLRKLEEYEEQDLALIPNDIIDHSHRLSPVIDTAVKSPTPNNLESEPSTSKRKSRDEEEKEDKEFTQLNKKKKDPERPKIDQSSRHIQQRKDIKIKEFHPKPILGKASSKKFFPPTVTTAYNNNPLFEKKTLSTRLFKRSNKITSLMDDGTINIHNKPNRVIIINSKGIATTYGDPKDYADAINGIKRDDNPVYKRYMAGEHYLFYKTESGHVVTIGPVSKIQPLIHKFKCLVKKHI